MCDVTIFQVSTDHKIRAVILAYSLSLSGIVQLGCLIFPKLYTVLFKVWWSNSSILTVKIVAAGEEHEGGGDASQESLICPLDSEYFTEQATEDGGAQELNN